MMRGVSIKILAKSLDFTSLDFFFWGYLEGEVYYSKPRDLEELRK